MDEFCMTHSETSDYLFLRDVMFYVDDDVQGRASGCWWFDFSRGMTIRTESIFCGASNLGQLSGKFSSFIYRIGTV